jgi:pimeloyl-ACP methyl ester carboxylesterase
MATAKVNGVRLFYEVSGSGEVPLVLVHGSWTSHETWRLVVPQLAESFRLVTFDRRGHSASERPDGQGSVRDDVADLAALIEHLELGPAWVAGNSFGGSITLRLAGERPDLMRGLIAHEPPLLALLAGNRAMDPMLGVVRQRIAAVVDRIVADDHAGAAEQFVETVALGPGAWAQLPPEAQQIMIVNAPTFLDEANDPDQLAIDLGSLAGYPKPALLTKGTLSPPMFAPIVDQIATALRAADLHVFPTAGHIPHVTHPEDYVAAIRGFVGARAM